jgi:ribose transport system ATP-binding protein
MVLPISSKVAALSVLQATKRFASTAALESVTLELNVGQILALVGPNGSGKSTLIRVLAGYHRLDSGSISIHGENLAANSQQLLRFVHQDLALLPNLGIADNLAVVQGYARDRLGTINWRRERARTVGVLKQVGLDLDPMTNTSDLGPVERTLVAIARLLDRVDVSRNILILDEPTARLPREQAGNLIGRLKALRDSGVRNASARRGLRTC